MCTLSLIWPAGRDGLIARLAFNRDELRTRPAALPPQVRYLGDRRVILPVDGHAGGTWIAANDSGLVGALINLNPRHRPPEPGRCSRGMVLPAVMHCRDASESIDAAMRLPLADFAPFRLLLVDHGGGRTLAWDGTSPSGDVCPASRPLMMTSSGLGDDVVEQPRRRLFEQMVGSAPDSPRHQDLYHRHRWSGRPHLSVNMNRYDARTVSFTTVELRHDGVRLSYTDGPPDGPSSPVVVELDGLRAKVPC